MQAHDTLIEAIKGRTACLVTYNGKTRAVEPHVLGITTAGNEAVRVWQVAGDSLSGNPSRWRLMRLDRIEKIEFMDSPSLGPRPDYNPDDRQMLSIFAQISARRAADNPASR